MIVSEDAGVGAPDLVGVSVVSKDAEHGFGATCSRPVVGHLQVLSVASGARLACRHFQYYRLCLEGFTAATDKNVSVTRPTDDHELPLQRTQRDLAPTGT